MGTSSLAVAAPRGRPRKSQLEKTIDRYYRELDRIEGAALRDIEDGLRIALRELDRDIARTLEKISKATLGQDTNDLSRQLARLESMARQGRETLSQFGDRVGGAVFRVQTNATQAGENSVIAALNAGFPGDNFGVIGSFDLLPQTTISELVGTLSDGSPVTDLARSFGDLGGQAFREEMVRGIALGLNPRQVAGNWRQRIANVSRSKAQTIARTEMMRVSREAARRTMEANSDVVKEWQWFTAMDSRTCPMCWAMHNRTFPLKTKMASHPNCRCAMLPVTRTFAELGIPGVQEAWPDVRLRASGEQLFSRLPEADKIKVLGPAAYKAYSAGEVSLNDFVGESDSPVWGKTRYARSLSEIMGRDRAKQFYRQPRAKVTKPTPPAITGEDAWITEAKRRLADGINTEADARELGAIIRKELEKSPRKARLQAELEQANKDYEQLNQELYGDNPVEEGPRREAKRKARYVLQQKRYQLEDEIAKAGRGPEDAIDLLKQVRPGYGEGDPGKWSYITGSHQWTKDYLHKAAPRLPKEWVEDYAAHPINARKVSRGHFWSHTLTNPTARYRNIHTPHVEVFVSDGNPLATAIHELTHYTEFMRPQLAKLQREFYNRRTAGEQEQSLKKLFPHSNYEPWEKTKLDRFISPYMGKDYGEPHFEIATMGTEAILADSFRHDITQDTEYYDFILGILAGV